MQVVVPTTAPTTPVISGDSPQTVDDRDDWRTTRYRLKNVTATQTVFIEKSIANTTAGAGYPWAVADGPIEVFLEPGESIYMIAAVSAQTVAILPMGR